MAPVQLKYVVSFTSQDDLHKANSLLSDDGRSKWLSHPKDRSGKIEIVFQLDEPCCFSFIDVGTLWCANLEIRVGRSDWPLTEEYKVLVPMMSLMSPIDCHLGRKTSSTNMFSRSNFSDATACQAWDRVQILCRQPYRKDAQLGISFVRIRNSGKLVKTPDSKLEASKNLQPRSVSSIQKHFFGQAKGNEDLNADSLKYKLLQMFNSTDSGSEVVHENALSRTAQLVLKASEISHNSSKHYNLMSKQTKRGLFSGSVAEKDNVTINEEIASFLPTLNIKLSQLDSITIADLRHKFERYKKRKLQVEEKRIFSSECETYICSLVEGKNQTESTKNKTLRGEESVSSRLAAPKTISKSFPESSQRHPQDVTGTPSRTPYSKPSLTSPRNIRNANVSKTKTGLSSSPSPLSSPSTKSTHVSTSNRNAVMRLNSGHDDLRKVNGVTPKVTGSGPLNMTNGQSHSATISPNSDIKRKLNAPSTPDVKQSKIIGTSGLLSLRKEKAIDTGGGDDSGNAKKKIKLTHDVSSEDRDVLICDSIINYCDDDDDDDVKIVSKDSSSVEKKSQQNRNTRTLTEINEAYANLYKSNPLTMQNGESSGRRAAGRKRKKLGQGSLNLISSFQSELSGDEDEAGNASKGDNTSVSPWLSKVGGGSAQKIVLECNKKPCDKDNDSSFISRNNKSFKFSRSKMSTPSETISIKHSPCDASVSKADTSGWTSVYRTGSKVTVTKGQLSLHNDKAVFKGSGLETNRTGGNFKGKDKESNMMTCPFCDVTIPSETYHAHCSACVNSIEDSQTTGAEITLDPNEEFNECPICMQRFPSDVLALHASGCGLYG